MPINYSIVSLALNYQLDLIEHSFTSIYNKTRKDIDLVNDFLIGDALYAQGRALLLAIAEIEQTNTLQTITPTALSYIGNAIDAYHGSIQATQIGLSRRAELAAILSVKGGIAELSMPSEES